MGTESGVIGARSPKLRNGYKDCAQPRIFTVNSLGIFHRNEACYSIFASFMRDLATVP